MQCDYQLENLGNEFCKGISKLKEDPFESDIVITQSVAMESYLNKILALDNTIAINVEYIQPRNFILKILKLCDIDINENRFSKDILVWKIYRLLPILEKNAIYAPLKNYVESDLERIDFRRYQLSKIIADIFDNYVAYRGEWLESWQEGILLKFKDESSKKHQIWQADLWRKLSIDNDEPFSRAINLIFPKLEKYKNLLPREISIFGISNLPKDFIEFFSELKRKKYMEVNFYYLSPCLTYWADVNQKNAIIEKFDNKLLASWGELGRDFLSLLLTYEFDAGGDEIEVNLSNETMLGAIQSDILSNIPEGNSYLKDFPLDNSIIINSCFSPMREVEVLYDQILHFFNTDKISPSDVIVMTPNIEVYTPYIKAIFNSPENLHKKIPFSIADCSIELTSKVVETFIGFLNILNSKMLAQDIYDFIASEPIANKFNFKIEDLLEIHSLIINSNIIWGKNAGHRKQVLGEEFNDINSWHFGLERLIAGYAFDSETIVNNGILPLPLKNNQPIILGKLKSIIDMIFQYSENIEDKTVEDWYDYLLNIVHDFFEIENDKNEELKPLYSAINALNNNLQNAQFADTLSLDIVKSSLSESFSNQENQSAIFNGGVTFCKLLPMRNIPFKIICILGMNEGEFPRLDKQCGFNLMQKEYAAGDRSMRKDDRYIFLETIMACREKLYLSYIGKSIQDNEEIPPSILISELIDYIGTISQVTTDELITNQPLQGFNRKYFTSSKLYSYSETNYNAAISQMGKSNLEYSFCDKELTNDTVLDIKFQDFINFFINPSKFFLNNKLGINLYKKDVNEIMNCENFTLNSLEKYNLKNEILMNTILEKDDNLHNSIAKRGIIPYGIWGDMLCNDAQEISNIISEKISEFGNKHEVSETKYITKTINGTTINLFGEFENIYDLGQVFYRPSKIKQKDELKAWLWHNLGLEAGIDYDTFLIGIDNKNKLNDLSITSKENHVEMLLEIFLCGLCKPLPLFLESSSEYAKILNSKNGNDIKALKNAISKWEKGYDDFGYDLSEDANRICFGEQSPLLNTKYIDEFITLANNIYGNVLKDVK